jgi:hypothetical protein
MNPKQIIKYAIIGAILIGAVLCNPFAWNDATERTVVTQLSGDQFVEFKPGVFYAGFFAKETVYPNQISVSHMDSTFDGSYALKDNTIEIGVIKDVRFNDATTAIISGITQYILPSGEKEMIDIHNAHRSPESFVQRRLAPYTIECLKSSAQLMSSEAHYSGGRAQMTQDYMDQLKNGSYLLNIRNKYEFDSLEKITKRTYEVQIQVDKNGNKLRKFSSIKEYAVVVGDAQILDVDYERQVDVMLAKKISASTAASVSKQELMTAQQKQLTAEAQGKQKLVEIEYVQKQEQTKQVVAAQTLVELAKQDLIKQDIALQASAKEAAKIKTLADAEAYAKQRVMSADGALDKKLEAWVKVQGYWATAFGNYQGAIVPGVMMGSGGTGGSNGMTAAMDAIGIKMLRDLSLDMGVKR